MTLMRPLAPVLLALASLAPLACAEAGAGAPGARGPSSPGAASTPPWPAKAVFVEDDVAGAAARARAEGKALFVDAWAPWCHTCLSMKNFVLGDPSLGALEDRVVFASVDTD